MLIMAQVPCPCPPVSCLLLGRGDTASKKGKAGAAAASTIPLPTKLQGRGEQQNDGVADNHSRSGVRKVPTPCEFSGEYRGHELLPQCLSEHQGGEQIVGWLSNSGKVCRYSFGNGRGGGNSENVNEGR